MTAEQRRAARRDALVDAALDLIAEEGWSRATMTAICARAGLTERYFYESFRNRDALFLDLVQGTVDRIEAAVGAAAADRAATPDARARSVVDAVLRTLLDDPRLGRVVLLEGIEQPEVHRARRAALERFEHLLQEHARDLFGPGARTGAPAALAAASLVGATLELLTRRLDGTLPVDDDALAAHLVGLAAAWAAPPA
ncbi:TetR/AcrR family transcriptional regulator [Patulibacter sp. SYSU D01012]|uniref:TetR/AcrR family transcriptional regulator n=1 Tax=Patulibacter sp. SYSU D01012 TaxID=2817381 RepID=UPI001B3025FC|nr:TetR/AcrR family transcriptional regulator [Patulibacter sp. SYSU D01012]